MIRSTSNMALKPAGRGACKRSRIVILASSRADQFWSRARHYGVGRVGCQDDSYGLMVWIRPMGRSMRRPLATAASTDEVLARASIYELPRHVLTVGVPLRGRQIG